RARSPGEQARRLATTKENFLSPVPAKALARSKSCLQSAPLMRISSQERIRRVGCALSALAVLLTLALPVAAEDAAVVPVQPGFTYGTILNGLEDASVARGGGFNLMSAFVAWSAVEPSRGRY